MEILVDGSGTIDGLEGIQRGPESTVGPGAAVPSPIGSWTSVRSPIAVAPRPPLRPKGSTGSGRRLTTFQARGDTPPPPPAAGARRGGRAIAKAGACSGVQHQGRQGPPSLARGTGPCDAMRGVTGCRCGGRRSDARTAAAAAPPWDRPTFFGQPTHTHSCMGRNASSFERSRPPRLDPKRAWGADGATRAMERLTQAPHIVRH